jgi:hypothetical protein
MARSQSTFRPVRLRKPSALTGFQRKGCGLLAIHARSLAKDWRRRRLVDTTRRAEIELNDVYFRHDLANPLRGDLMRILTNYTRRRSGRAAGPPLEVRQDKHLAGDHQAVNEQQRRSRPALGKIEEV